MYIQVVHTHTHTPLIHSSAIAVPVSLITACLLETASTSKGDISPQCETEITMTGSPDFPTSVSVQFSSVARLCPTLCDPMNHSTPGLPVHHQLLEFTQTHEQVFIRSQTSNLTFVSLDIFILKRDHNHSYCIELPWGLNIICDSYNTLSTGSKFTIYASQYR